MSRKSGNRLSEEGHAQTPGLAAPKLKVAHLGKTFGDLTALQDINLAIERGEFIALVGPSGCGKTTFLRIVAGLEPATSGEVMLDGRAVRAPVSAASSANRPTPSTCPSCSPAWWCSPLPALP